MLLSEVCRLLQLYLIVMPATVTTADLTLTAQLSIKPQRARVVVSFVCVSVLE